jgi:SAM-dependent methyltransferase
MERRYELPHIWHQPKGTRPYTIYWCGRCDFGTLLPLPSHEELDHFYGDHYFSRYAGESEVRYQCQVDDAPERPTLLDRVRVHLAWRLDRGRYLDTRALGAAAGPSPLSICDIGCGNGDLLAGLTALGYQVVGVEVDESARRRATAKGLDVFPGYAEALPDEIRGRSFDVVSMTHVLEHCLDPLRALRNVAALVRPGGTLVVEVPNNAAVIAQRAGPAWFYCDAGRHLNFFTAKSLASTVALLDFQIVDCRFSGYVAAFLNDRVTAERLVWDLLYSGEDTSLAGKVARNSKLRQWMTLGRTFFAAPARKYEVVGIIARRRVSSALGQNFATSE